MEKEFSQKVEKRYGDLSEFVGRGVEYYRSSRPNNTAIYFTETGSVMRKDRATLEAHFEVLVFDINGGDNVTYIKYPNTDYFVEISGCHMLAGRGEMKYSSGQNHWEVYGDIVVKKHAPDMLLSFGSEFNFLMLVAKIEKANPYVSGDTDKFYIKEEIDRVLSSNKYLKIPSVSRVEYCFYSDKHGHGVPTYILVVCEAYNYKYETCRVFAGFMSDIAEFKITNFVRYRDGGTTIIKFGDGSGKENELFVPTPYNKDGIATLNKSPLSKTDEETTKKICEKLNLVMVPESKEEE